MHGLSVRVIGYRLVVGFRAKAIRVKGLGFQIWGFRLLVELLKKFGVFGRGFQGKWFSAFPMK